MLVTRMVGGAFLGLGTWGLSLTEVRLELNKQTSLYSNGKLGAFIDQANRGSFSTSEANFVLFRPISP